MAIFHWRNDVFIRRRFNSRSNRRCPGKQKDRQTSLVRWMRFGARLYLWLPQWALHLPRPGTDPKIAPLHHHPPEQSSEWVGAPIPRASGSIAWDQFCTEGLWGQQSQDDTLPIFAVTCWRRTVINAWSNTVLFQAIAKEDESSAAGWMTPAAHHYSWPMWPAAWHWIFLDSPASWSSRPLLCPALRACETVRIPIYPRPGPSWHHRETRHNG
jgi:hypothetical protein